MKEFQVQYAVGQLRKFFFLIENLLLTGNLVAVKTSREPFSMILLVEVQNQIINQKHYTAITHNNKKI